MKIIILLFTYMLCTQNIIDSNSIDGVKIGMSIDQFLKVCGPERTIKKEKINLEGDDYDIYNIYKNNEIIYAVEPICDKECKVWRIWIYSKDFKTKEGIGIGNTLGEIRNRYKVKEYVTGEGRVAIQVEGLNISFFIKSSEISHQWWTNQTLEGLGDNLTIDMLIIT